MKKIAVLGSTGSIGTQTLDVVRATRCATVTALAAHQNIDLLETQIEAFSPRLAAVTDPEKALALARRLKAKGIKTTVLSGDEGLLAVAGMEEASLVVNALVGYAGLRPTLRAIAAKKDIALANKETLVAAGGFVMAAAADNGVTVYPVDSEHSAIFQCLRGNSRVAVERIYLTASGGPFLRKTADELEDVTPAAALAHPNWSMGAKITVDSATMMNKGFEVIEARWLFDLAAEQIDVLVHPQSVVHSMAAFRDGAVMAQLGEPDMRVPIQYALTYPERIANDYPRLDFLAHSRLTFEPPDETRFPCLRMAFEAMAAGGCCPAVMNAANEIAVDAFLRGQIAFLAIPRLIERTMSAYTVTNAGLTDDSVIEAVFEADAWARRKARELITSYQKDV